MSLMQDGPSTPSAPLLTRGRADESAEALCRSIPWLTESIGPSSLGTCGVSSPAMVRPCQYAKLLSWAGKSSSSSGTRAPRCAAGAARAWWPRRAAGAAAPRIAQQRVKKHGRDIFARAEMPFLVLRASDLRCVRGVPPVRMPPLSLLASGCGFVDRHPTALYRTGCDHPHLNKLGLARHTAAEWALNSTRALAPVEPSWYWAHDEGKFQFGAYLVQAEQAGRLTWAASASDAQVRRHPSTPCVACCVPWRPLPSR